MSAPAATTAAAAAAVTTAVTGPAVRLVLQRVNSAALLVDNVSRRVTCGKGVVCHIAFFDGASPDHLAKAVKLVTESRIFAFENPLEALPAAAGTTTATTAAAPAAATRSKPVALVEDRSLSLMVVPQASIAGRVKGKVAQYHSQAKKDIAFELYNGFVAGVRQALLPPDVIAKLDANGEEKKQETGGDDDTSEEKKSVAKAATTTTGAVVVNGTYGNIQSLLFDSPGPMTHVLDVDL